MSMENHGGIIFTQENLFVHQCSLAILPASHLVAKQEELEKEIMNLALLSIFVSTLHKFHNMGPMALLPL
jgi:hypothetical protein